jgi:hypothetical protein
MRFAAGPAARKALVNFVGACRTPSRHTSLFGLDRARQAALNSKAKDRQFKRVKGKSEA